MAGWGEVKSGGGGLREGGYIGIFFSFVLTGRVGLTGEGRGEGRGRVSYAEGGSSFG